MVGEAVGCSKRSVMAMHAELYGPCCGRCGGGSVRAVRTRQLAGWETVYYLAYQWACSVCGYAWVDDGLERINASAASEAGHARRMARRAS
jgi:hypothetical protein